MVYLPTSFLEPWTRRRLRRIAEGHEDLEALLVRLGRQRRVTTALDPVVDSYLADTAAAWAHDTVEKAPHLPLGGVHALAEAGLQAGYLFGRLLVATADVDHRWSSIDQQWEQLRWLEESVPMVDWSGVGELIGSDAKTSAAMNSVVRDMVHEHGLAGEVERRAAAVVEDGMGLALLEHSATRPPAGHVWVDLTVIEELLPEDTLERVWIGEALGCLLARLDRKGRCSEADLRDAADELGGERGHRYFRQLRDWGVIDYALTRRGDGTVRVVRHRELRGGPVAA